MIITGRDDERLRAAAADIGGARSAAVDAHDHDLLVEFFAGLDEPVDHVFVAAGGPYYAPLADIDLATAKEAFSAPLVLMVDLARVAPSKMNAGGTLLFMSGTGARRPAPGMTVIAAAIAATTAAAATLALEIAPVRINLIAAGFVDTPLSARLLGEGLDRRREELARTLPVRRVVQADDVASVAFHLMLNGAVTGSVYDVDGGQSLLP